MGISARPRDGRSISRTEEEWFPTIVVEKMENKQSLDSEEEREIEGKFRLNSGVVEILVQNLSLMNCVEGVCDYVMNHP